MSDRKLKGLLTPTPVHNCSTSSLSVKKLPSFSPSPTIVTNLQKTSAINDVKQNTVPAFYEIPGLQNFFYSPFAKFEVNVQQSPWLKPFEINNNKDAPPFSHVSGHTAADSRGDQTGNQQNLENDISNSLCNLVKKLNIQIGSQPKTLEELLQRSFLEMPSHSILQSPRGSAFPSPFVKSHTSNFFQGKALSSIHDLSLRGNSFRKSPFIGSTQPLKTPVHVGTDEGLILQIADLINRDDGRIRSAISELLAQYGNPESLQKSGIHKHKIFGDGPGQPYFLKNNQGNHPLTSQHGESQRPKTISLSNGLTMNALNRSPKSNACVTISDNFNTNPRDTKIEAARKELFVISETAPETKKPSQKQQEQDFNLFDFLGETTRSNLSPLISSGSLFKASINSSQPYFLTSHSMSQQTTSLSTNSSHSDNQRGANMIKKTGFDASGKPLVSSTFRLNDDILLQTKLLNDKFTTDFGNIKAKVVTKNSVTKSKSPVTKSVKTKSRTNKKGRSKGKKVSVEDYIRHVNAREESNLTIDETWEESEDWDDIDVEPTEEKPKKVLTVA